MSVSFNFRRVLLTGLAVGGLALVLVWPGWRSVLAQGYQPIGQEAFLGCGPGKGGAFVVVLVDPAFLPVSVGDSCAYALSSLAGTWFISQETQFYTGAEDDDDERGGSGFRTLFRLTRP